MFLTMSEGKELYMCRVGGGVRNGNGFPNNILNLPLASPLNVIPARTWSPNQRRLPLGLPSTVSPEPLTWSGPQPAVPPSWSVSPRLGHPPTLLCSLPFVLLLFFFFSNSILTHGCLRAQRSFLLSLVSNEYKVILTMSKMPMFRTAAIMHVCTCI